MRTSIRSLLVTGAAAALLVTMPAVASATDNSWELYTNNVLTASAVYDDSTNTVTVTDYEIDYLVPTLDVWPAGNPNGAHQACVTAVDLEVRTCSIDASEGTRLKGNLCMWVRGTTNLASCTAVEVFRR